MQLLKASELKLADTILLFEGAYGVATVTEIRDGQIHMLRPYVMTVDFSMGGKVIAGLGFEDVIYETTFSSHTFKVLERKELR